MSEERPAAGTGNGQRKRGRALTPDEHAERLSVLAQLESWIDTPMQVLGFVWLALLILELTHGLSPLLATLSTAIWVAFIADFALRMAIAPARAAYLRHNWLTALSLLVPALRVLRFIRVVRVPQVARAARGARLVGVVGSVNRGMHSLASSMGRRGVGYVVMLTILVTLAGAAGMYAFENDAPGSGITSYFSAVWWTAMILTSLGSEYWPRTPEGRVLTLMLAIYGFAVWGYITASLATFFVGNDAERKNAPIAGQSSIDELRSEIAALRAELRDDVRLMRARERSEQG